MDSKRKILIFNLLKSGVQGTFDSPYWELVPPYASDVKLTFDPSEWPGENLGFQIVHSNTYTSINSIHAKTMRS